MCSITPSVRIRAISIFMFPLIAAYCSHAFFAQSNGDSAQRDKTTDSVAMEQAARVPVSADYLKVQERLAQGWNTWDANSVTTHVLLPYGLAIHIGMKHNTRVSGDAF